MEKKGIYIYGIIPNFYPANQFMKLENMRVYTIPFQKISAIVSDMKVVDYTQLNKESLVKLLINHQKTIEEIMDMGFSIIVPVRIGTFMINDTDVKDILKKGYSLIMNVMDKINNHFEVDVATTWVDFNKVLQDISELPAVNELKQSLLKKGENVTQSDQFKLGAFVKELLDKKKESYALKINTSLLPFTFDARYNEVMNDQMITNTAYLINKNNQSGFDKTIDQLDEELGGEVNFKYVCPLPCYSFYTIEIKKMYFELIEAAKNELELRESATETEIKQAYLNKAKIHHPDKNLNKHGRDNKFNRINKAYKTLLDYSMAVKQSSNEEIFYFNKEKISENSLFVKLQNSYD